MAHPEKEKAASPWQGLAAEQINLTPKSSTKLYRIETALRQPEGLNRFDAARIGDTCLNSTVAVLRSIHGNKLVQRWEVVPSRYSASGVRVLRYWLI